MSAIDECHYLHIAGRLCGCGYGSVKNPAPVTGRCGCPLGTVHKCASVGTLLNPVLDTTAQQRFDALYISSLSIAERMGVSRPAVLHARRRGLLPDPVCVNDGQIYIWERATVEPYLVAWDTMLKVRRGQTVTPPAKTYATHLPGAFLDPLSHE